MAWYFICLILSCTVGFYLLSRQLLQPTVAEIRPFIKRNNILEKCRKLQNLKTILVAINYNFPHYTSIPTLRRLYGPIFGKVVFCGNTEHPDVIKISGRNGYQGYDCVGMAIRMYPNFSGYMHTNDDVLLNWWNLAKLDTKNIWTGYEIGYDDGYKFGDPVPTGWMWWQAEDAARKCQVAFHTVSKLSKTSEGMKLNLPQYLDRYFANTNNRKLCVHTWSDIFYIPKEFSETYAKLSKIYRDNEVFLEVAVPGILTFFLNQTNHVNLNGVFLPDLYGWGDKYSSGEAFYEIYSFNVSFYHPFKLGGNMKTANNNFFKNVVMHHGEMIKQYCLF